MALVFFMFSMVKAITPRYRYDQLMRSGWKVFLPLSLVLGGAGVVSCKIRSASAASGLAGR